MLNINTTQTIPPGPADAQRRARIDRVLELMSIMRAHAGRGRLRHLIRQSVSLTHVHVLSVLRSEGAMTVGELAGTLDVSVASATGIVSRMVDRGLVGRQRSEEDRRLVTVHLVPGGEAALEQLHGLGREHLAKLLGRLTPEELDAVLTGFQALHRAQAEWVEESSHQGGADR